MRVVAAIHKEDDGADLVIDNMYPEDLRNLERLLRNSGEPVFEAIAACIREQTKEQEARYVEFRVVY